MTLDQMAARRAQLADDLAEAQTTLATAQEGLITGTAEPRAVIDAQAALSALKGALATADERVQQLTEAENRRKAHEHREALIAMLTEGAQEAEGHKEALCSIIAKTEQALLPLLAQAFEQLDAWQRTREIWAAAFADLCQTLPEGDALALLQTRTDLLAVRTKPYPSGYNLSFDKSAYRAGFDFLPKDRQLIWQLMFSLRKIGKV